MNFRFNLKFVVFVILPALAFLSANIASRINDMDRCMVAGDAAGCISSGNPTMVRRSVANVETWLADHGFVQMADVKKRDRTYRTFLRTERFLESRVVVWELGDSYQIDIRTNGPFHGKVSSAWNELWRDVRNVAEQAANGPEANASQPSRVP